MTKNRVIPQMFDVRPVDRTGNLDWEKIRRVEEAAGVEGFTAEYNGSGDTAKYYQENFSERDTSVSFEGYGSEVEQRRIEEEIAKREELEVRVSLLEAELAKQRAGELIRAGQEERTSVAQPITWQQQESWLAEKVQKENEQEKTKEKERILQEQKQRKLAMKLSVENRKREEQIAEKIRKENEKEAKRLYKEFLIKEKEQRKAEEREWKGKERREKRMRKSMQPGYFRFGDIFNYSGLNDNRKAAFVFAFVGLLIATGIGGVSFAYKGIEIKGNVLGVSQNGYASLTSAIADISTQNFEGSSEKFAQAFEYFSQASKEMDQMGALLNEGSRFFPYISKISSGKNVLEAGTHLSAAGGHMNEVVREISQVKSPLNGEETVSFLELFKRTEQSMRAADGELRLAQENIEKVKIDDLPEEIRDEFLLLKEQLPAILDLSGAFLKNSDIFADLLGGNGPRKYLFLFQNNNEMRATGGFIGSYGLLDISNGHVKNFFIDGIFNPDGQLTEKIVPPQPIQKISAAWSLHDSNWFPDFPTSAKEAILFYEKTGGPTVDGVITFTPVVLQKLLEITGPIDMPEYGVVLDSGNFIEKTQYEVEADFDKEENKPKKILSDLAPLVLDRIMNSKDPQAFLRSAQVFLDGLEEKHMLIYSENKNLQGIISQQKWSGEILPSQKDYLSVINTNINGYKTDGIIEEKISHKAEIAEDGSIVNTVSISRKHNGGNSAYEWWNKVNANYMRVYVPKGSELLSVEGQTREINEPPLDYEKLGFKKNKLVQHEEENMIVDENTGTRIYEENGKTVFANWTYVSPQETMTITYKYTLPFRLFPAVFSSGENADSYSLVAQKQAGSVGSAFVSEITYPKSYEMKWGYPENAEKNASSLGLTGKLDTDKFIGVVFEKK